MTVSFYDTYRSCSVTTGIDAAVLLFAIVTIEVYEAEPAQTEDEKWSISYKSSSGDEIPERDATYIVLHDYLFYQ